MAKKKTESGSKPPMPLPKLNPQIVREIVDFSPGDHLPDEDRAGYNNVLRQIAEIEKERDTAVQGMDENSVDYLVTRFSICVNDYSILRQSAENYNRLAAVRFGERYYRHWPELEQAGCIIAKRTIKAERNALEKRMHTRGLTLDDARKIDDDNNARGISGSNLIEMLLGDRTDGSATTETLSSLDVLTLFSDDFLKDEIKGNLPHVIDALEQAHSWLSERTGISADDYLTRLYAELLPQKWTLTPTEPVPADLSSTGDRMLIQTCRAQYATSPIHKLADVVATKPVINAGQFRLRVSGAIPRRQKAIVSQAIISLVGEDADESLYVHRHLTPFQIVVGDAVMTCVLECDRQGIPRHITDLMIFRAMPGMAGDPNLEQINAIREAVRALRYVEITYFGKEEFSRRGLKKERMNDTYLSYVECMGVDKFGHEIQYYDFTGRMPMLLNIALDTGQLITVPAEVLRIPMRMDDEKQAIVRYLMRRIARMQTRSKIGDKNAHRIRLDTLCDYIGIESPDKFKRSALLTTICKILDYWKSIGQIGGYEKYKEGRNVAGFEIENPNITKAIRS